MSTIAMRTLCGVILLSLMGGCTTSYPAGPRPVTDVDDDLRQLAKHFNQKTAIDDFYAGPKTELERDNFIANRLVVGNIEYLQYVRKVTGDRQLINSAADILVLSLNLAGTATGAAGTKTILAAIAAGITGSKAVIDREYFFEKTMPALLASMNAQRKAILLRILEGMRKSITEYRFENALADLHEYEYAGTLVGSIQAVQADAAVKEQQKDAAIAVVRKSPPYNPQAELSRGKLTDALASLNDLPKAKAALVALTSVPPVAAAPTTLQEARDQLQAKIRDARTVEKLKLIADAFTAAGIPF